MVGFGGGAFVFNQIQTVFINPDNLIPDEAFTVGSNEKYFTNAELLDRVPTCFLLLSGCYAALQIIGIILLTDPPKENAITKSVEIRSPEERNVANSHNMYSAENRETRNEQLSKIESNETKGSLPVSSQRVYMVTGKEDRILNMSDNTEKQQRNPKVKTSSVEDPKDISDGDNSGKHVNQEKSQIDGADAPGKEADRGSVNLSFTTEGRSTGDMILMRVVGEPKEDVEENTKQIHETSEYEQKQYTVLEMAKTKEFWILYFTLLLNGQGTILVSSMYKAFGQTFVEDDHLLAFVGSFSAVFNSIGRPIWGIITDMLTYKVAMMFLCSCMCILLFTMESTQFGGPEMFFAWICAFYFSLSGNYSMMPATVSRTFGTERVGINYSVVFTSQIITSFVSALLASQLQDAIGWFGLFQLTGGLIFISLLLTCSFDGRNRDGTPV